MNENRMCDLAEMKERLISCVKYELEKGIENVNTVELGEVVDMIKDLAQCEKYCWEAEYYQTVVEAMEDDDEPEYESYFDQVLIHELGHCALFSFDLICDIHQMVSREFWIEAEEWICNFIADYGMMIFFHSWRNYDYTEKN